MNVPHTHVAKHSAAKGGKAVQMKRWTSAFAILVILSAVSTSCSSNNMQPHSGLAGNSLRPCPSSPNCVCSEDNNSEAFIQPVSFTGEPENAWIKAVATISEMNGEVIEKTDEYLHASFTSGIFRFVDDMELRIDKENSIIHLRSASRTGYYDFGVNRKRAERFRKLFQDKSPG